MSSAPSLITKANNSTRAFFPASLSLPLDKFVQSMLNSPRRRIGDVSSCHCYPLKANPRCEVATHNPSKPRKSRIRPPLLQCGREVIEAMDFGIAQLSQ